MEGTTILNDIIEILVGGLTGMAQGFGTGLGDLVKSIFLQTGETGVVEGLSTFGTLVIVFAGVSLAIGMCRWVINFITSIGARNR